MAGTGCFLPDNIVTNEDLARLGCDADWIVQRTGILERRHAPDKMATSDMAVSAARQAIEQAGVNPGDIDLCIVGTMSPDHLLPATACTVQDKLGLQCPAFDISAACAGFLYSLVSGMQFVSTGCSQLALVIGADTNSRVMNPDDKKTFPLFGDGAGAVLLAKGSPEQGLLSYTLGADGSGWHFLCRPMGGSRWPFNEDDTQDKSYYVRMDGRPVFKWAVRLLQDTANEVIEGAGLQRGDINHWILHQANRRIIDAAVDNMQLDPERVVVHLERYGNTSAASVPIALDETNRAGGFQRGDTILMSGFGAGLSWGTGVWRW
jgi:3-oxoacyl-[acyl-carrier-protein] synthase-3